MQKAGRAKAGRAKAEQETGFELGELDLFI